MNTNSRNEMIATALTEIATDTCVELGYISVDEDETGYTTKIGRELATQHLEICEVCRGHYDHIVNARPDYQQYSPDDRADLAYAAVLMMTISKQVTSDKGFMIVMGAFLTAGLIAVPASAKETDFTRPCPEHFG